MVAEGKEPGRAQEADWELAREGAVGEELGQAEEAGGAMVEGTAGETAWAAGWELGQDWAVDLALEVD